MRSGLAGAQRAADHADRANAGAWTRVAWIMFLEFSVEIAKTRTSRSFTTEEFRQWATMKGLPEPPDPRAYGNITKKGQMKRTIEANGYAKSAQERTHGRDVKRWLVIL